MGQSNFHWIVVDEDGETMVVRSTLEDLPNIIDWTASDIVAIVRLELVKPELVR